MTANLIIAIQSAAAVPRVAPEMNRGWLDPTFIAYVVGVLAQLILIGWLLVTRADESWRDDS